MALTNFPSLRRRHLLTALVGLVAAASGCRDGISPPFEPGTYTVWGDDIMIGFVIGEEEVSAYACDGRPEGVALSEWFHGPDNGGHANLVGSEGSELTISTSEDSPPYVRLTVNGVEHEFEATYETDPKLGIYWGETDGWLGGWVFATPDSQRGAVIKRNTGDPSFVALQDTNATEVVLPDSTTMTIQRLAAPRDLRP
ncbi:hypothetical protein [Nannocystis sp. SCPEA4]|uniref:hypothetical protein n=1 Tax=Nannocystis sp. SCPEA4 TaxID=2996787 RepID=UPI00227208C2|nr:hypothetical protein [Nannocystis sp. SCPEA4]MCY1059531.1 hypothetical protein [Nannocystis sp. SCPEA4]